MEPTLDVVFQNHFNRARQLLRVRAGSMTSLRVIVQVFPEAVEIAEGSQTALQAVVLRECQRTRAGNSCPEQVTGDAHNIALQLRQAALVALQARVRAEGILGGPAGPELGQIIDFVAALDGFEGLSSYSRCCDSCLERRVFVCARTA